MDEKGWMEPVGPEYAFDEPEFMAEFGRAMAAWGNVEHALSSVFASILNAPQPQHARSAFHSVVSFRDRLNLIDAPMEMVTGSFPGEQWSQVRMDWNKLKEVARKSSRLRNKLAHMHVWHSPSIGTFGHDDITSVVELPSDPVERKRVVVTVDKIRQYRKSFDNCAKRINTFRKKLLEEMANPMRDVIMPQEADSQD